MRGATTDPVLSEFWELRGERRRILRVLRELPPIPRNAAHEQLLRSALAEVDAEIAAIGEDPSARAIIIGDLDEHARLLRAAVQAWREETRRAELHEAAAEIIGRAAGTGRSLLAAEAGRIHELTAEAETPSAHWRSAVTDLAARDRVLVALGSLRIRQARRQLRDGLLLTEQMRDIIDESVPALLRGEPLLLLGETGGAKTALAEHLATARLGREPELISGYGDISSAQLVGAHELRVDQGATVSVFVPGPLVRTMTEGRPLILDEINAMPPEFLKRLNRVLQLRPGDTFAVQEDAGREITLAPGFAILATANEQTPHRYRGIERLSAELINRFGANAYRVRYPDSGRAFTETPTENLLLAAAAVADRAGDVPFPADELLRVARAAFISQQVFAGVTSAGFEEFISTEREIDGRPGLEESVLAPRTLVAVLQKVAGSGGRITLERALQRFVDGVMHAEDRQVLRLILESQGFSAD